MSLRLTNTLTRQKEEFVPQNKAAVSLYTCGLTVYDYGHIGNFRTFIVYDLLRRTLEEVEELPVNHVMNITDVGHLTDDADAGDDKMEKGAKREGKTAWDIAEYYIDAYHRDAALLNLLPPTTEPRATEHIEEQIALVQQLEERGFTYTTSDGVYFDTGRLDDYGKLAQLDIEGLEEGARIEKNPEKKNATDFALWKRSVENGPARAMEWDSPWGKGFPGWHLECSAMAMKYLGNTMDIHAGGIDHIPVHHTNEIAQSESATGEDFARWWLHSEFLQVDGAKMSKSKGNFYTIGDLVNNGYSPLAFRYLVLGAHYGSKMNFTWKALDGAQSALNKLIYIASTWDTEPAEHPLPEYLEPFVNALRDDLNTPQALAALWDMVKSDILSDEKAALMQAMDKVLGLNIREQAAELRQQIADAGSRMEELLRIRKQAREAKDYEQSDKIRDDIREMGFVVEDTDHGQILRPV